MEILITLGINFISQILKEYVAPNYGEDGVQVAVFLVACLATAGYFAYEKIEGFKEFVVYASAFFGSSMVFYEILWKRFDFVKSTKELE
jgi:hypothetical protein